MRGASILNVEFPSCDFEDNTSEAPLTASDDVAVTPKRRQIGRCVRREIDLDDLVETLPTGCILVLRQHIFRAVIQDDISIRGASEPSLLNSSRCGTNYCNSQLPERHAAH